MMREMSGPVHSISHAFAIMRLLAEGEALNLSSICKATGLSPSSCLNVLKTLTAEGALTRGPHPKQYRLSPAWYALKALRDSRGARLVDRAPPLLLHFALSFEAAVGLWEIVSRDRMQLVARAESDAVMRLTLADDQRQPLGGGAAGRAIAAAQDINEEELKRRFALVRWQMELPFSAYKEQVQEAATKGYAFDRGNAHRGVFTAAVALADISPGFCITASFVGGKEREIELRTVGDALVQLRADLIRLSE